MQYMYAAEPFSKFMITFVCFNPTLLSLITALVCAWFIYFQTIYNLLYYVMVTSAFDGIFLGSLHSLTLFCNQSYLLIEYLFNVRLLPSIH